MFLRTYSRQLAVLILLSALAALVVGCGSSGSSSSSESGESSTTAESSSASETESSSASTDAAAFLKHAEKRTAEAFEGTGSEPPTTGPKPEPGKSVWIIPCAEVNEGCATPAAGVKEAAEEIGWKATIFDGKFDPSQFAAGINQAVAAHASAIVLVAIDCRAVKGALENAKKANVIVVGIYSYDCSDSLSGGNPNETYFTGTVQYEGSQIEHYEEYGALRADMIIAETHGEAKVINISNNEFLNVAYVDKGFVEEMEKCSGCEIVETVELTGQDFTGNTIQTKVAAAIQRNPEANAVKIAYDGVALLGAAAAIAESGRKDEIYSQGGEGFPDVLKLLEEEAGITSELGIPARWIGWAAIDTVNRLLHGEEPVDSGAGFQAIDKRNIAEYPDGYEGNVDYKAAYRKAWGLG